MILHFSMEGMPADLAAGVIAVGKLPYRHIGRADASDPGADCAGAVEALLGLDCKLPLNYELDWQKHQNGKLVDHLQHTLGWPKVSAGIVRPWDVLVFMITSRPGDHAGVYLGAGCFAHCFGEPLKVQALEGHMTVGGLARPVLWRERLSMVFRPIRGAA